MQLLQPRLWIHSIVLTVTLTVKVATSNEFKDQTDCYAD